MSIHLNPTKRVGMPALNLSESQIRYAMQNTDTVTQAAEWLHVDYYTYKKYAKRYIDEATGKNLFDLQKSLRAKKLWPEKCKPKVDAAGKISPGMKSFVLTPLQDIWDNKHPNYNRKQLVKRMLHEGYLAECCDNCGYNTRREFDFKMPLKLWYRNSNDMDLSKDNIRLLCFNCYYLLAHPIQIQDLSKHVIVHKSKNSI